MVLNSSVPVRFEETQFARLKEISDNHRIPVAQLVRMAVDEWLDNVEKTGQIIIPVGRERVVYPTNQDRGLVVNETHAVKPKPAAPAVKEPSSKTASVAAKLLKKHSASGQQPDVK